MPAPPCLRVSELGHPRAAACRTYIHRARTHTARHTRRRQAQFIRPL